MSDPLALQPLPSKIRRSTSQYLQLLSAEMPVAANWRTCLMRGSKSWPQPQSLYDQAWLALVLAHPSIHRLVSLGTGYYYYSTGIVLVASRYGVCLSRIASHATASGAALPFRSQVPLLSLNGGNPCLTVSWPFLPSDSSLLCIHYITWHYSLLSPPSLHPYLLLSIALH